MLTEVVYSSSEVKFAANILGVAIRAVVAQNIFLSACKRIVRISEVGQWPCEYDARRNEPGTQSFRHREALTGYLEYTMLWSVTGSSSGPHGKSYASCLQLSGANHLWLSGDAHYTFAQIGKGEHRHMLLVGAGSRVEP
jgi:hypothetical protein